ncbi:prohormone-2 [Cephus cinctus]|uniref:Prohormone-2 n=1 Tax=Cephus cinctus TaxID=211228 RepID=A0AAJ7CDU0_CEPCN|nr:prohormone-2 [Cephus cinctus]
MLSHWLCLVTLVTLAVMGEALSTTLMEDLKKADQLMRPKTKRAQEILMFGNQQNRQAENTANNHLYPSNTEKRTLGTSGLEDIKAAFAQSDNFERPNPISSTAFDRKVLSPYDKNYEYSKILANQITDGPKNWDVPSYQRYYDLGMDGRRKRSDNSMTSIYTTTPSPVPSSSPASSSSSSPISYIPQPVVQAKRSLPMYQDARYKRDLVLDPQEVLTILSFWENERRKRNWPGYEADDEYTNDDDSNMIDVDDEDPRTAGSWLEEPVYPPHHFTVGTDSLAPLDIGIPRTRPSDYYDQYGNQFGQQYTQYGSIYPQRNYYPPEKRYMMTQKRSQGYENYGGRNYVNLAQLLGSQPRSYPSYEHRLVY